jgi:hypothetical protein
MKAGASQAFCDPFTWRQNQIEQHRRPDEEKRAAEEQARPDGESKSSLMRTTYCREISFATFWSQNDFAC